MRIPTCINKLTIGTYVRFKAVQAREIDEKDPIAVFDRDMKLLSVVTDQPVTYFENLRGDKLKNCLLRLSLLTSSAESTRKRRVIWVKGKRYKATKNEHYLSANQGTAIRSTTDLARICAILYQSAPYFKEPFTNDREMEQIEQDFLNHATIGQVNGTVFFYSKRSEKLKEDLRASLMEAEITIQERMIEVKKGLEALGLNMVGTT
jgi:hypothetical protein